MKLTRLARLADWLWCVFVCTCVQMIRYFYTSAFFLLLYSTRIHWIQIISFYLSRSLKLSLPIFRQVVFDILIFIGICFKLHNVYRHQRSSLLIAVKAVFLDLFLHFILMMWWQKHEWIPNAIPNVVFQSVWNLCSISITQRAISGNLLFCLINMYRQQ